MGAVARNGDKINQTTIPNHIERDYYDDDYGGYISASKTSATVNGTVSKTSGNVYANGVLICGKGDNTIETDSYSINYPYYYAGGAHTGSTSGSISGGSSTVFIGGKAVARVGDSVTTHGGTQTSIQLGSPNVFAN